MFGLRGLARMLLAGIFVFGGVSAFKRSSKLAEPATKVVEPVRKAVPGSPSTEQLIKANAGVQVVAGGLFALGILPRVMSIALGASLVPTTLAGHRYWEIDDEADRTQQQIHFMKNAALLGGLVFAALDTGGRPSVFWSGRKAIGDAAATVASTAATTKQSLTDTLDR